jgi:hypothetical protein
MAFFILLDYDFMTMRLRSVFLITVILMPLLNAAQGLEAYRWKNRILLLCEKGEDFSLSKSQIGRFGDVVKEAEERQLLLLVFDGISMRDRYLRVLTRADITLPAANFQGVLLIGKDGGVKYKSDFFVDPESIFEIIDSMPMRRAEMRQKPD